MVTHDFFQVTEVKIVQVLTVTSGRRNTGIICILNKHTITKSLHQQTQMGLQLIKEIKDNKILLFLADDDDDLCEGQDVVEVWRDSRYLPKYACTGHVPPVGISVYRHAVLPGAVRLSSPPPATHSQHLNLSHASAVYHF